MPRILKLLILGGLLGLWALPAWGIDAATNAGSSGAVPVNFEAFDYLPQDLVPLGTEELLSEFSRQAAGKVYYELAESGEAALQSAIAVVDAVPLADFKKETEFGRLIAEHLLTDLADRGLNVTELRLGREINILPLTGEFNLSRNIGELASRDPALDCVVVSTFSNTRRTLILQGRMVDLKTGRILTSWRQALPLNRDLRGLFKETEPPFKIAVRGVR